jgi:hypothetical protein
VPAPAILKPRPLWTGKQVFSMLLPHITLERTSSWAKDDDERSFSYDDSAIYIKRGTLVHGAWVCSEACARGVAWRAGAAGAGAVQAWSAGVDACACCGAHAVCGWHPHPLRAPACMS